MIDRIVVHPCVRYNARLPNNCYLGFHAPGDCLSCRYLVTTLTTGANPVRSMTDDEKLEVLQKLQAEVFDGYAAAQSMLNKIEALMQALYDAVNDFAFESEERALDQSDES